jgi:predicted permease
MSVIPRELRFAARQLARRPGLTVAVALTLAVGITAAASAFALVNAAFLRAPAVADAGRLVNLYTSRTDGTGHGAFSYPDYLDLASSDGPFAGVLGYGGLATAWNSGERTESLFGELVTGSYFGVLGIRPAAGRLLTPDDDRTPGQHPVVVIGHAFWQARFGGAAEAVGRTMTLNGRPYTIVGVAPPEFNGLLFRGLSVDVWAPTAMMGQLRNDELANRNERWLFVRARLAPGASADAAGAAVATTAARLAADHPATNEGRVFHAVPSASVWVSPDADRPLKLLSTLLVGACLLVLVVGASNVMGMLVARTLGRSRDLAVQAALGATRRHLWRQLLAESILIAGLGGVLGLAMTAALTSWISGYRPPLPVPIAFDVSVDAAVLVFVIALTGAAGILLAAAQLWRLRRADFSSGLRDWMAAAGGVSAGRRHWLLVPQVAGAVVLLVIAGLLTRSVASASRVDLGFDIESVGMLTFNPGGGGLDEEDARQFFEGVADLARATSGVTAVTVTDRIPLGQYGSRTINVRVDGSELQGVQTARLAGDYFDVFGIALRAGRVLEPVDLVSGSSIVVNEAFVSRFWPSGIGVGQTVIIADQPREVVGVVADVKVETLGEAPTPVVYQPLVRGYASVVRVAMRTDGAPESAMEAVVRDVDRLRPNVALMERRTMAENVGLLLTPFEIGSAGAAALGAIAILVAAVGLHGLVAFAVTTRTREFGVRLALGASAAQVTRAATGEIARATLAGLVLGLLAAAILGRSLSGFVFGVAPLDPVTFAAATAAVMGVAILAALGPVRRLRHTNLIEALRAE